MRQTTIIGLVAALAIGGCATNHTVPDLDARLAQTTTVSGLFVNLQFDGREVDGPVERQEPQDEALMPVVMLNLSHMFAPPQLERIVPATRFFMPSELAGLGYGPEAIRLERDLLAAVLDSAIARPRAHATGAGLEALRRFAKRSNGGLVLLAHVQSRQTVSEHTRTLATFLTLLNAAAGIYGVPGQPPESGLSAHSRWALLDPVTGEVLRAFEEKMQL